MPHDGWNLPHYGLGHWILLALALFVYLYPMSRVLRRIGVSPYWSLLALVPLANLLGLWVLAFSEWPAKGSSSS